jgi:hypothetical protein
MKVSMPAVRTSTPANLQRIQTPALESNPEDISDIGRSSQEMGPDAITPFVRAAGGAVIGAVGGIGAGIYYGMQHGAAAGVAALLPEPWSVVASVGSVELSIIRP